MFDFSTFSILWEDLLSIFHMNAQGLMEHPKEIVDYFNDNGVSVIFLLRRNMLRRLVSILANSYDKDAKVLNGIHVSHVHSHEEVLFLALFLLLHLAEFCSNYGRKVTFRVTKMTSLQLKSLKETLKTLVCTTNASFIYI